MKKLLLILIIPIITFSCKPFFNLKKETKTIQDFANGILDFDSQMNLFPDSYWDKISKKDVVKLSDSLNRIVDSIFFKKSDIVKSKNDIIKISSTKKIEKTYFKIIHLDNVLTLKKNKENIYLYDFKSYLDNNLIEYIEYDFKLTAPLTIYFENFILGFWEPSDKKWNYIYYNDQVNQYLFGSKTAKEIIQLYFDEIFIPAQKQWSKKDLDDFFEVYNEVRFEDTYNGLDFDKFCKCKAKFHEKVDELNNEIPDEYYESQTYIDIIQKCRIYSKIN